MENETPVNLPEPTPEHVQDLKLIKDSLFRLLKQIGFINTDGTMRETINMKMIMSIATKATTQNKKFQDEFSFLGELLPLVEKYKNL